MLASLINFSARQDSSVLNLSSQPVKGMQFYRFMIVSKVHWSAKFSGEEFSEWIHMFHGQRELEAEVESASDTELQFEPVNREDQHEEESMGEDDGEGDEGENNEEEGDDESNMNKVELKDEQGDGSAEPECGKCEGELEDRNETESGSTCKSEEQSESEVEGESETMDNRESKESDIESEPALAMAGVTCPVFSHQVEAKEVYPVSNYVDRATDIFGYHDGRKFKDTVF